MATSPIAAVRKVIDTSRRWARSRAKYRKLLDSKRARKADTEKACAEHVEDTHKLEVAVIDLERSFRDYRSTKTKRAFPWREVIGVINVGTTALGKAMETDGAPPVIKAQVIDVTPGK